MHEHHKYRPSCPAAGASGAPDPPQGHLELRGCSAIGLTLAPMTPSLQEALDGPGVGTVAEAPDLAEQTATRTLARIAHQTAKPHSAIKTKNPG
jgi:hypothetical protein